MLLWLVLDEDSNQIVHTFVFVLVFVSVDVQLLAKETVPILLKLSLSCFSDHLSLNLDGIFVIRMEETLNLTNSTLKNIGGRVYDVSVCLDFSVAYLFCLALIG